MQSLAYSGQLLKNYTVYMVLLCRYYIVLECFCAVTRCSGKSLAKCSC